ncbi:uncharacterized protein LOC125646349 isoform X2 [Ostrea edulis]|uniref:uncharacterized protein LOC125646349 isoform X2 n=1 Tax=Ostrea edulis TaxID=37623 RepID=UPI0024AE8893|nr:uncharacterized protein LOC125646349 isoform X2 [Ostrea edulis]
MNLRKEVNIAENVELHEENMKIGDREQAVLYGDQEHEASVPEFKDGREYIEWLDRQLPYLETFEPDDRVHYYFFRSWSKEIYHPGLESLNEKVEEDVDLEDECIEETMKKDEKFWEEGTKPEFKDGREFVQWLGRKLRYLEPFAPDDAVHYYFSREWSKVQFQPKLDLLVEECMEETMVEESINEEEMEEIVKDKEETSKKEGKEGTSKEDCMEGTFNVEGIEETEGVVETQRITQYDHVDGENDEEENENPYIRLMTSPLILEGLLLKNQEDNTKKSSKESKIPREEVGTLSNFLSADNKNSSNLLRRWSWLNPFTPKNKKGKEQKNQEKKTKKERRAMLLFFRLFGR